jgi:uncharacterized protein YkwD
MPNCEHCGKEVMLTFICAYCGKNYCVEHRLPESHQCAHLPMAPPPYLTPIGSEDKVSEDKTSKLGLCPQCYGCSDKVVDYDAKTITFKCERCGFNFSQLKATPHNYVEPPEKPEIIKKPTLIEPPIKQKHFPLKKVITLSIIVVIVGVLVWSAYPNLFQSTQIPSVSPNSSATPSLPSTTPPNILSETYSHEELVNYALLLINSDRKSNGLQNVTLSDIDSGQRHAEDMLEHSYFSHWDTKGLKPHMRYTLAGGTGAVSENIAAYTGGINTDLKTALKNLEWSMMYDDAASQWGHRDNILTPFHNKVSIGIAYTQSKGLYFVEDFVNDYVEWSTLTVSNGEVNMAGTIEKTGLTIQHVAIYFDDPLSLTAQQLGNPPYKGSYDMGTYVGMALPSGWESVGGITITADTWTQAGQNFQISFSLSQAFMSHGKGVYTLCLQSDLENTATEDNSLTNYSIWFEG